MKVASDVPFRELPIVRGTSREIHLYFVDQNAPVPRPAYDFTDGSFRFRAKGKNGTIEKTPVFDAEKRKVTIEFASSDTENFTKEERMPFEMVVIYGEDDERRVYPVLQGDLVVSFFGTVIDL